MIGAAPFNMLAKGKKAEIYAISMRDIEYQLNKQTKPVTDPKTIVPEEYHDFIDVFSKQDSDTLSSHSKYDHKVELLEERQLGHSPLRGMSVKQLEFVKKFLEEHLKKGFIEASSAPCSSPILLAKKPGGGVRFCVDYRKLNELTKKDAYPLPLIEETLAQLKRARIFTKIDIRQAFFKLRMAVEAEDLTTMTTRFGAFKWKVLPFGLTGGPASWQRFINDVLWEYLNDFCTAYLDDILIYSNNMKEHREHVRKVLAKLREAGIQADVDKCEFHVTTTKYLGMIISTDGIKMDPAKVEAIRQWNAPTCVKEVRAFMGFCNFYRRFIKGFSKVVAPLNELTKKGVLFKWTHDCEEAFQAMKERVCQAPILIHFDSNVPSYLETDASDYVSAGVLSQEGKNGVLHPVAYFSKKMTPAECNYEIHDKELLAIIRSFEQWRPELEGTGTPVKVLTDHKGLEYFMSTKKLTPRQARWAEFLSEFNFVINYQSGTKNAKADALTRRPNETPIDDDDERQEHRMQVLLPPNRIDIQPIDITDDDSNEGLDERVKKANRTDDQCKKIRAYLLEPEKNEKPALHLQSCKAENDLLYKEKRLWVPGDLQLDVVREIHDQPAVGHPGFRRTMLTIQRHYYWPGMKTTIARYLRNCHVCKRSKAPRDGYNGLLEPLPIPERPWTDISMDFVTGLPECQWYGRLYNAILMVVDRLAKEKIYIPCSDKDNGTNTEATARMLVQHVWSKHGLPTSVVSDRGPQFVSGM